MHERRRMCVCVPHKEMEVTEKNRCRVRKRPTCDKREEARWDKCLCFYVSVRKSYNSLVVNINLAKLIVFAFC